MDEFAATRALGALSQPTRLAVFRLLVREGPDGLPAGAVAARLGVQPATLSFHLAQLERAGLLAARRQGRQIRYAADIQAMRRLVGFLLDDCCHGHPEACVGLEAAAGRESRPQKLKA